MPFDPNKPQSNTNASSAEMRAQLLALHQDIQTRATGADIAAQIQGSALNPSSVQTFAQQGQGFSDYENQLLATKIDELITALRRP